MRLTYMLLILLYRLSLPAVLETAVDEDGDDQEAAAPVLPAVLETAVDEDGDDQEAAAPVPSDTTMRYSFNQQNVAVPMMTAVAAEAAATGATTTMDNSFGYGSGASDTAASNNYDNNAGFGNNYNTGFGGAVIYS